VVSGHNERAGTRWGTVSISDDPEWVEAARAAKVAQLEGLIESDNGVRPDGQPWRAYWQGLLNQILAK